MYNIGVLFEDGAIEINFYENKKKERWVVFSKVFEMYLGLMVFVCSFWFLLKWIMRKIKLKIKDPSSKSG